MAFSLAFGVASEASVSAKQPASGQNQIIDGDGRKALRQVDGKQVDLEIAESNAQVRTETFLG
jgi:hypothetical protein